MSLSINNVRGVLSSVSFNNQTSNKAVAVDSFEMVRGGKYLKPHKNAAISKDGGKVANSSASEVKADTITQNQGQFQGAKAVDKVVDTAQVDQGKAADTTQQTKVADADQSQAKDAAQASK